MKKIKILLAVLFLCLGMATMGWCLSIVGGDWDGTEVGGIDTFLASTNSLNNSNWKTETAWVNSILAPDTVTFSVKNEPVSIYNTNATGVYAFNMLPPESEYFLVKNATWWALFANLAEMDWGVLNSALLPGMNIPGDFTISHVSRFDGTTAPVPEPATILLLGMGLFGLVAAGKKRVFKK